jgi:NADPH-dependent 2,4-dienoyl-CoA reductase/sulfur reductase-like enzyme
MRRIVVVGASLAGVSAVEELRLQGFGGEIVLVGAEDQLPYDRPPLSKALLAGEREPAACLLRPESWYAEHDVELALGVAATGLDVAARRVALADRSSLRFDGLVIATGSRPIELAGDRPAGVQTLRTLDDAVALRDSLHEGASLAVVGGGFIGAEVASTAIGLGASVTLIEALSAPLARVLGDTIGGECARLHRAHGVDLRCGVPVTGFAGSATVRGVELADGSIVAADVVLVGLGVRPNTYWLDGSGVAVGDGVLCDSACRSSVPGVVAAGDVARWEHPVLGSLRLEHWDNAIGQGHAAAVSLLHPGTAAAYAPTPYVWSDQHGLRFQLVGRPAADDEVQVVWGSFDERSVLVLYARDGVLTAGLTLGAARFQRPLRELVAARSPLDPAVARLRAHADAPRRQGASARLEASAA